MEITKFYSPNFDKKKKLNRNITAIIIHYTGMQSERESIKRLTSIKSKVSCHYLINRSGKILKMVRDENIAWHAGKSKWCNESNCSDELSDSTEPKKAIVICQPYGSSSKSTPAAYRCSELINHSVLVVLMALIPKPTSGFMS